MPKVGSQRVWVILSCASPFRSSILVGGSMSLFLAYARAIKGKSYKVETFEIKQVTLYCMVRESDSAELNFSYGALAWGVDISNIFISFYLLVFLTLKCVKLLFMVLYESSKVGHDSLEENSVFVAFFRLLSLHIILQSNAL